MPVPRFKFYTAMLNIKITPGNSEDTYKVEHQDTLMGYVYKIFQGDSFLFESFVSRVYSSEDLRAIADDIDKLNMATKLIR